MRFIIYEYVTSEAMFVGFESAGEIIIMASETSRQLREDTKAIINQLTECLAAAAELDRVIFRLSCSPGRRLQALVTSFSKMHELIHNADVHVSRVGERLINEAALSELLELTKKGAA